MVDEVNQRLLLYKLIQIFILHRYHLIEIQ